MYRGLAADPMRRHDRAMGDTGRYVFAVIVAHQVQDGIEDHPAPPTCNTTPALMIASAALMTFTGGPDRSWCCM